jgi:hypothetical protein
MSQSYSDNCVSTNVGLISSKKLHLQIMHLEETFGYCFNDTDDKLVIVSL